MSVYIIGDVHGHLIKLIDLLAGANLIDEGHHWSGGDARLWFMGDFFDRGPHGIGVVDLIMRLQPEAEAVGGQVRALLGNHEVLFLGAQRFQGMKKFSLSWQRNGGQNTDMALITSRQLAWLRNLPALARVEDRLLMHADAMFYLDYGQSIDEANESIQEILYRSDAEVWDRLLEDFAERMAFSSPHTDGFTNASDCLAYYGGQQIVHGHTPIQYVTDSAAPNAPLIYNQGLCVNVDGGMYLGGTGFVYCLPE
ncbi:MAG: serine/threonine protein phosphatase [Chloroflexi bacterium]|nr:serine/threonine protein phosphatase [Chloroflexota bacterium]